MMSIDEAIRHAKEVAEENYKQGFLCHANPNDEKLDKYVECGRDHEQLAEWLEELKQFKNLQEHGRLLELPCAVGDSVWDIDFGCPCSYEVTGISFGNLNEDYCEDEVTVFDQVIVYYTNSSGSITGNFAVSEIGKTVFLTQEEAEKALEDETE